jgi:hypothetical protein
MSSFIAVPGAAGCADNFGQRRKPMQFALLIYESPEAFAARKNDDNDPYLGAWRAYYKALVEAGVYVGGDPLQLPETGTTVRMKEGKRRPAPTQIPKSNLEDSPSWSYPHLTQPSIGQTVARRQRRAP